MHWWTSGGESRAVAVFAKEYNKRGGTWVDDASVGPQAEHAAALNRIAGGNPPTAMQWNIGVAVRQLAEQGMLTLAGRRRRRRATGCANLPPLLVKNMTYDGHVIAVPVNIHGANYQFYSIKVFNDLKMQPPKTLGRIPRRCAEDQGGRLSSRSPSAPTRSSLLAVRGHPGRRRRQGPVPQGVRRSRRQGGRQRRACSMCST